VTSISEDDYFAHYGILRKSGRYPYGSGGPEYANNKDFLGYVSKLQKQGLSEAEIARGMGINTSQLRAAKSIARNEERQASIDMAQRLKDKGLSNVAIGKRMNIGESSVRALLEPGAKDKSDVLAATSNMLKEAIDEKKYIDIGTGVETQLGISQTKLSTAVAALQEQGYKIHYLKVRQLGTGKQTTMKVLSAPDVSYSEVSKNRDQIKQIQTFSEDGGRSYLEIQPPLPVNSKRVAVRYAEEGGAEADGVIYVRPGVSDLDLGGARYAQVRIAVDGSHYLKGMAMYKDDLPDGVDLMFNTNKSDTGNKLDAMKELKSDPDNPFGAVVRQRIDPKTGKVKSAMNIVNEEGDWDRWSKNLSSQMLSKQSPKLARDQLALTYERKKQEFEDIMRLTNPAVREKLLQSFSDGADSAAVHLKAAALPRQRSNVILPITSMSDKEIYAPNFRDGERVVLIRYPHGGIFEIPELTVNNRHPEARRSLGQARDAVGINPKVAERLSGADFDGDTVLVIPNNKGLVKTAPALEGLKGFDPRRAYPEYEGMKRMSARTKGFEMGFITNLIADMTIRGAPAQDLARAVRHSMVIIDAEKHNLNYRQSAIDNGISQLKAKYQGSSKSGASTLISRANSTVRVPERKGRSAKDGGPIDRATGKKVFRPTGETYVDANGRTVPKTFESKRLAETDDAHTLSSGTPIEKVYADHSNRLKQLANDARKAMVNTKTIPYSPSAKIAYANEVSSLRAKLAVAQRNRPLERQAQLLANATVQAKKDANPDLEPSDLKKIQALALAAARNRTGARKKRIEITPNEWAAIQAGALSNNTLKQILENSDLDKVKELATPRTQLKMTPSKMARARTMLESGYTQAEVADALGVSLSTLKTTIDGE
jgi:DNA-binding CsgD family transcriptional regulator/biotin operon repressor